MRYRGGVVALFAVALGAGPAHAAGPLAASASATAGAAPLTITLTATEGADSYNWTLGDGGTATGRVVQHAYAEPGAYTAVVAARYHDGSVAQAGVVVTAFRVALTAPATAGYGQRVRLRASLAPVLVGAPLVLFHGGEAITRALTGRDGTAKFIVRAGSPVPYAVRYGDIPSAERSLVIRPVLETRLAGSRAVGEPLRLNTSVKPAGAGTLRIRIWRNGRLTYDQTGGAAARVGLRTRRAASYRIAVNLVAAPGFAAVARTLTADVVRPHLALRVPRARGPSARAAPGQPRVRASASRRLVQPGHLRGGARVPEGPRPPVDRPGRPPHLARALAITSPDAALPGHHIEVSKSRQYLLVVRSGRVTTILHVSTGATGNTPLGRWHVYRKVPGWDWVLWYPMYFLRGFAIHGYPSVPAYPASHGCVRVPMWIAPRLNAQHPYGTTVYVYVSRLETNTEKLRRRPGRSPRPPTLSR